MASSSVFTDHVLALQPGGPPPAADHVEALWQALRGVLIAELRKRGLWTAPPAYLGVYGADRWTDGEALQELMAECYASAFLDRLRSLHAQLKVRPNIDGLIFRNVRNFLHDTQRKHDPLGFRVFNLLRSAVLEALAGGALRVVDGDPGIRNSTVLGAAAESALDAADIEWTEIVAAWNDQLLPELVTALGKAQQKVVAKLRDLLAQLPAASGGAFRFRDVCNGLKNDVRRRWGSSWQAEMGEFAVESDEDELPVMVRLIRPDSELEDRDGFAKLLRCVSGALDGVERQDIAGGYLRRLWTFARCFAADLPLPPGSGASGVASPAELPSGRKLAALLDIPRDRLPFLRGQLGQVVRDCHGHFRNPAEIPDSEGELQLPERRAAR